MLIDDDLQFEDDSGQPRPATIVNAWLRKLPFNGVPSPSTWRGSARAVKGWMEFLARHDIGLFDSRDRLRRGLSLYAEHRAIGPPCNRFARSTWNKHMSILSMFYCWALDEGWAHVQPFTYRSARALFHGSARDAPVNLALRPRAKPHSTLKYLEPEFTDLFLNALRGLTPEGALDTGFRGRERVRNTAIAELTLSTGLRSQEFSYLLVYEVPALPPRPSPIPIPFPVPEPIAKGRKFRTTWISYQALETVHRYMELDRAATAGACAWLPPERWGEPLMVTRPDRQGGRINGVRRLWETLSPDERRRLIAPSGSSCLLALQDNGAPFTAWGQIFARTSSRIRTRYEPRFPNVHPHLLRHTFAIRTLEYLVTKHYADIARTIKDPSVDAAWVRYLSTADPLLVLRDLLGHTTVAMVEVYLSCLDTTRIYRDAYEGAAAGSI